MAEILFAFVFGVIKILLSLLFSVAGIYFAIRVFDALTGEIDEWREIRKGNVAVSIYFGAVIFTFSLIIAPSLQGIYSDIGSLVDTLSINMLLFLVLDLLGLILTIIISSLTLYFTLVLIDAFSHGMKKFQQLKKGNIAVAITMAAILIGVGIIVKQAALALAAILDPMNALVTTI